ncbi:hypothetical protein G4B88_024150 [Cannabis sativa]|uniref:Uncharacterized protein n=1 Tax=Cannabis sativa TaxID=3483 RepID=A0A7J6H5V6_CANSA|nr:hypothetical protein G4B88_024150 [Cannabis sativa]
MHIDRKQWDLEVLHDLFEARDVDLIMQVPLSDNVNVDSWFWGKEPNGFYSVKRGRVALVDELLMVAWGIWKARNELLWQGRSSQAADVPEMRKIYKAKADDIKYRYFPTTYTMIDKIAFKRRELIKMDGKSRLHNRNKWDLSNSGQSINLLHTHIFTIHSLRQLPRKSMQHIRQDTAYHLNPQAVTRTHPPTRPEWKQLEALPVNIHAHFIRLQESLGPKLVGFVPRRWVSTQTPGVNEDRSALANVVAADVAIA